MKLFPGFGKMIFRQLFEPKSSTYTYILGCEKTRQAVLIDGVDIMVDRDLKLLKELDLTLVYDIETHVHADHVFASHGLRQHLPDVKTVLSKHSGASFDHLILVEEGDKVKFGDLELNVLETPGHTAGCLTFVYNNEMCFTGDSLLIRGCGRTDFQGGSPKTLFESIHKLYKLPDTCAVYVGHNYNGQLMTTIGEEKKYNARASLKHTQEQFIDIMNNLKLAKPQLIDIAVPANFKGGIIEK
jgi:sulfur dioxygenase